MIAALLEGNHKGFLPERLRRGEFLKWLKRVHAWLGLWGAALGLLFGTSGFMLNHRALLKIKAAAPIEERARLALPESAQTNPAAFARWLADYAQIPGKPRLRVTPGRTITWDGKQVALPPEWNVALTRPAYMISATYTQGNRFAELRRSEQNLWGVVTNLHKGVGVGVGWVLLVDTLAGALVTLCLTGVLLWSKLHGPRLAALALIGGAVLWGCLAVIA